MAWSIFKSKEQKQREEAEYRQFTEHVEPILAKYIHLMPNSQRESATALKGACMILARIELGNTGSLDPVVIAVASAQELFPDVKDKNIAASVVSLIDLYVDITKSTSGTDTEMQLIKRFWKEHEGWPHFCCIAIMATASAIVQEKNRPDRKESVIRNILAQRLATTETLL